MACTEKYQSQVKLLPDHTVGNYVCGQPFPNASIKEGDPDAGWKAVWNYEYQMAELWLLVHGPGHLGPFWRHARYSYVGAASERLDGQRRLDGIGCPSNVAVRGRDEADVWRRRKLPAHARRVLPQGFLHPSRDAQNHTLPVPGASNFEFKEFTGFYSPFDIRGTAFIIYRYADPHREDDGWAYIPNLRRVRRISAEVKSDSLLGTDHTLEDFYSFSGRELEWHWRFLGWKDQLAVVDSVHAYTYLYGPNGIIPNDTWTMRRFAVMERTPLSERHPYKSVVEDWDSQNYDAWLMEAFDHKDKLWKVWEFQKKWSESFDKGDWMEPINKGAFTTEFQSVQVLDVQNDRGTIWIVPGGFPNLKGPEAEKLYDINKLEEIHR